MRRCLAILLLALLPFQFSWAAVATYCAHEAPAAVAHVGHHEHQHQGAVADKAAGAADLDCSHCHGGCAAPPMATEGAAGAAGAALPALAVDGMARTLAPTPPDRPQWRALA
jgi:hypothetical protein